jgi:hypothetical protein
VAFARAAKQGIVIDEVAAAMTRRAFRAERARAAAALATYLRNPCPATERSLLDATHDLEAAAAIRGLRAVSGRRTRLAHVVAH